MEVALLDPTMAFEGGRKAGERIASKRTKSPTASGALAAEPVRSGPTSPEGSPTSPGSGPGEGAASRADEAADAPSAPEVRRVQRARAQPTAPAGRAEARLHEYLLSTYRPQELLHLLRFEVTEAVTHDLGQGGAAADFFGEVVVALKRRGLLDPALFAVLRRSRPALGGEIDAIEAVFAKEVPGFHPTPTRTEEEARLIAELDEARVRRAAIRAGGGDEGELRRVRAEIRDLKDQLRDGASLHEGEVLADRYRLLHIVGRGGIAEVWAAEDLKSSRRVAARVLHSTEGLARELFIQGWKAMQTEGLREDPGIPRLLDAYMRPRTPAAADDDALMFQVLELIGGPTLEQALRTRPPLSFRRSLDVLIQVAKTLEVVHRAGLVHKDVKPHNILLAPDRAVLIDFDIVYNPNTENQTKFFGSHVYIAPELRPRHPGETTSNLTPDARADVYSLGVTLLSAWRHEVYVDHEDVIEARGGRGEQRADIPDALQGGVREVLRHALARDRDGRYATMTEMRESLQALAEAFDAEGRDVMRVARAAHPEAPARLDQLLAVNPEASDALLERGMLRLQAREYERALACFREVERLCGTDTTGLVRIGTALVDHERFEDAHRQFSWASRLGDVEAAAWLDWLRIRELQAPGDATDDVFATLENAPWALARILPVVDRAEHEAELRPAVRSALVRCIATIGADPRALLALANVEAWLGRATLAARWRGAASGELVDAQRLRGVEAELVAEQAAAEEARLALEETRKALGDALAELEAERQARSELASALNEREATVGALKDELAQVGTEIKELTERVTLSSPSHQSRQIERLTQELKDARTALVASDAALVALRSQLPKPTRPTEEPLSEGPASLTDPPRTRTPLKR